MKLTIGYAGLSHLGINYAVASAMKGFNVVSYDESKSLISSLNKKKLPFFEKNLKKNLIEKFENIKFTSQIKDLNKCDLVFISKDVPTNSYGKSNTNIINKLIKKVTTNLNKKSCLIILCQVPPGFCQKINWEKSKLFYQVETLIFSDAQNRALFPERIIIGKFNKELNKKYSFYLKKFKCPVLEMSYQSAELAKISINMFLISSVTTTNLLSEVCEKIGANWKDVSEALKLDKRIGKYAYVKPGLGISGGNLERDLETIKNFIKFNNLYVTYNNTLKNISNHRKNWIYLKVQKILEKNKKIKRISVCGLSYKEGTNSVKNSPSIFFINKILKKYKVKIDAFDPLIKENEKNKKFKIFKNLNSFLKSSQLLIIATPWKFIKKINLLKYKKIKHIVDPYNQFNFSQIQKFDSNYISMGKS